MTRPVLLQCDNTGDLYLVIMPSPIPHAFLVSQHMWHQRLGHPGGEVLRRLVSSNFISYNKEKPLVLYHACQLGKHVRLSSVSFSTVISSCFDIIHSDVWTSPILSLSGFKYYISLTTTDVHVCDASVVAWYNMKTFNFLSLRTSFLPSSFPASVSPERSPGHTLREKKDEWAIIHLFTNKSINGLGAKAENVNAMDESDLFS
ncbi:ribonuclease H-like domain-containing protein [Tanacetum coccineum]